MNPLEPLWPTSLDDKSMAAVTLRWMPVDEARSACVVLPGGSYAVHADHEAETIGHWLNDLGISAAVLRYRVAPNRHPAPLTDAAEAIKQIRARGGSLPVGILGFSAGGHLASTVSTHYLETDPGELARPDYAVLCYPVIHLVTAATHLGSRQNLLADLATPMLLEHLSNERHVTSKTPPTFLWHTAEDAVVDPAHSLMYASALSVQHVPFELHIYERGGHGLGLALQKEHPPEVADWAVRCATWLRQHGWAR